VAYRLLKAADMKRALLVVSLLGCSSDPQSLSSTANAIEAVPSFGPNPGNLNMYRYVPSGAPKGAPLVVTLHGCTQKASDFEATGWSALAESKKFYVVYAEQTTTNNPVSCFDWWGKYNQPSDKTNITRGKGEPESIKQMVDRMKTDYAIDPSRVYVVGFSAGGAEASVLLALYPDVFSAGAILAGVPFDCPSTSNADVWNCMSPGKDLSPADWGNRVRAAFAWKGTYPRVSIWQGDKDTTVSTNNHRELIDQWTNVHGVSPTPTVSDTVDGHKHARYGDNVESYFVSGMGHGVPVDPSKGCGRAGAYVLDAKICSTKYIAQWFGLDSATTPPPPPPPIDAGPPPPPPSGDFTETVSSGLDHPWMMSGWDLAAANHSATPGQSLHARATSAMNKVTKSAAITVRAGTKLRYVRKTSLRGANIASSVRFALEIGSIVDERTIKFGTLNEADWVARELDTSAFAGTDVTLRLVAYVEDPWSYASFVEAWVDDIEVR
jgi:poly(hydroxyalkanoate) depolymerase family esterase